MWRCLTVYAGASFLLWLASGASGQLSFLWTPPSVEVSGRPGAKLSFTCTLANEGEKELRFSFYPADISEREEGFYEFAEGTPSPFSCKDWIKVEPRQATLKPKEAKDITCTVSIPGGTVAGGRYAAVCCELQPEEPEAAGPMTEPRGRARLRWRMGTIVMLTVTGGPLKKALSVSKIEVTPGDEKRGEALVVSATAKNEGNVHLFAVGRLLIRSKEGRRIREAPLGRGRGGILPGATVKFSSILRRRLAPGEYTVEANFKYGSPAPAIVRFPFTMGERVAVGPPQAVATAFSVEPRIRELPLAPGAFRAYIFTVRNLGDKHVQLRARTVDISYDEQGELEARDTVGGPTSCASWITVAPAEFELRPGQNQQVRISVSAPSGQAGGRYAGIEFIGRPSDQADNGPEVSQMVALLLTVGKAPSSRAQIEALDLHKPARKGDSAAVIVKLRNTGEIHLRPKTGTLLLKAVLPARTVAGIRYQATENELEKVSLGPMNCTVLPGGLIELRGSSGKLTSPGKYVLEVSIDYGGESLASLRKEFAL